MELELRTNVRNIKSGVEARAETLGLTTHGKDESEALANLHKVALTWCFSLLRINGLDNALATRGIVPRDGGHEGIKIDLFVDSRSD